MSAAAPSTSVPPTPSGPASGLPAPAADPRRLRGRYRRILRFFAGVIARVVWWDLVLRRVGFAARVRATRAERYRREASRFRELAIAMGGVMIKIGQFLSSRLDVLPREITDELANLQDEVPAEDVEAIRALAEVELGAPLTALFASFDPQPLAAASLGQVHRATLGPEHDLGFTDVVVKVQRPGIDAVVATDLAALARVGRWVMHYKPIRTHADVPALLREFGAVLHEELDYVLEAGHARTFGQNFADDPGVQVPRVVDGLSRGRVLTLEDVSAIKIGDYDAITASGVGRPAVAQRLLAVYLRQIFEHGFVHADPHPGNLFVTPGPSEDPAAWRLTFVDFGMVTRIDESVKDGLRELLVGIGTRDAQRVVRGYRMLGMLLPDADTDLIAAAGAGMFDRYWGLSMSELRSIDPREVAQFAHQYRDLVLDLPFQAPQNLLYLVRTVAILSGMSTGLDPDVNLWEQVGPYAQRLVADEATAGIGQWLDRVGEALLALLALPTQASRVLAQVETQGLRVRDDAATRATQGLRRSVDRLSLAVVAGSLVTGASVVTAGGRVGLGIAMFVGAGIALLGLVVAGRPAR